ncbi:MAG: RNA polymerase sigma factor [Eubacterium sp.]|nr:RNA polymerase sigma factor [Eubacterium sp.]
MKLWDNENIISQFNHIYERYYKSVKSYFAKRFDINEADDLAQITFMKLWSYLPNQRSIKNEKSLIFSIAKNVLYDRLRQKSFESSELSEIDLIDKSDFTSSIELQMLISKLPMNDRELLELKRIGMSSREIAKIQGTKASTVRSRLQKIKSDLKKSLDE